MSSILDEILEHKRGEVAAAKQREPADAMPARAAGVGTPSRGFARALAEADPPAVIAEIKRRSPSRGMIRADFDAVACARAYEAGGAACLSVLTDQKYFGGELAFVPCVREAVSLPILRKEFVVDTYQIDEARVAGADAVLLIASALSPNELAGFARYAAKRGLDALVEVHDEAELEVALDSGARLVGVNNRDLRTFRTDLAVTERLAARLASDARRRDVLLVAESGIHGHADVLRLQRVGAAAFLVGESLMREADVAAALRRLRGREARTTAWEESRT
jgi:indole-3-glycerol phosphate synthase